MNFNKQKLKKIISNFKKAKVLVIGDIILDHFIWGKVERISPEAPVPIVNVLSESLMPGGAANVAVNLRSLFVNTALIGVIGKDASGDEINKLFSKFKISKDGIISSQNFSTIKKSRVIAHHQQVVRVDRENKNLITENDKKSLINKIEKILPFYDAVIIEDYGKGVVSQKLVDTVVKICKDRKIVSSIDPKIGNRLDISGIDISTPNLHEAAFLAEKVKFNSILELEKEGEDLRIKLGLKYLLVTLGEDGMVLFHGQKKPCKIPTCAKEVFDVSGAGDTVVSLLTAALVSNASVEEAAYIANLGAGIVVGKLGTASVTLKEMFSEL